MIKFGKFTKKNFGKKPGKFLVNLVGMFILWMVMGIWHGGWRYIVGVSLWYWVILMLGDLLAPIFQKITTKLGMKTDSFSWHLFQSTRTYVIYAVGATFFSVGVSGALPLLKRFASSNLCEKLRKSVDFLRWQYTEFWSNSGGHKFNYISYNTDDFSGCTS